jgi:hypothetical protein
MKVSRREFAILAGAAASSAQSASREEALPLLEAEGKLGIFEAPEWLDLLREAITLSRETRAVLRSYPLANHAEPALTFPRD